MHLLSLDLVDFCRAYFILAAVTVFSLNAIPPVQKRFFAYGARASEQDNKKAEQDKKAHSTFLDTVAKIRVPHWWFIQFYIVSVASSILWGWQLYTRGPLFMAMCGNHVHAATMTSEQVAITWALMAFQGGRRLYECLYVNKPSKSTMSVPAWILGITYYTAVGMAVWADGIRKIPLL
jgi:3-oxo-5-alpha-steroid 4-dehydrogenase 3